MTSRLTPRDRRWVFGYTAVGLLIIIAGGGLALGGNRGTSVLALMAGSFICLCADHLRVSAQLRMLEEKFAAMPAIDVRLSIRAADEPLDPEAAVHEPGDGMN